MSRRSRRNRHKIKEQKKIEPQQEIPAASISSPPVPEESYRIVGPKKFKQENYRTDAPILFYSLLAFVVFLAIAIIIILAIGKSAVEGIYR
ncbi:MAG: hypothetical protein PHN59_05535 [Candidatus Omnitrophica bacterium]|nr:hypothetical protein [Candidatus Omnitrophota bacterium]